MAWKWYDITSYRASVGSPGYYGTVQLYGDRFYGLLSFHKDGPLPDSSTSVTYEQRFHGYMDFQQLAVMVDLLRNEGPIRFGWNEADPNFYRLITGSEPVGEGDGLLAEDMT